MKSIAEVQDEIVEEFELLGDDRESTVYYIMELGQKMPPLDEPHKVEGNLIKGCQSKVWLTTDLEDDRVIYRADSNTAVTKGLISLLVRVFSGRRPEEVLATDLNFIERIGMGHVIGSQRSSGLAAMIKQMKFYALAYQAKLAGA